MISNLTHYLFKPDTLTLEFLGITDYLNFEATLVLTSIHALSGAHLTPHHVVAQ